MIGCQSVIDIGGRHHHDDEEASAAARIFGALNSFGLGLGHEKIIEAIGRRGITRLMAVRFWKRTWRLNGEECSCTLILSSHLPYLSKASWRSLLLTFFEMLPTKRLILKLIYIIII